MAINLKGNKNVSLKKKAKDEKPAKKKAKDEKPAKKKAKDEKSAKKGGKKTTTKATFRNITCKTCEKPIHKGGVPDGTPHKCCPVEGCGVKAIGEKAIEEKFGYREWQDRKIPQSSCRTCRGQWAKGREEEKPAKKSKKDKKKDKKKSKKSRD